MVRCPDADFVLVIARALPSFMLTLVDTGIFYSVRSVVYDFTAPNLSSASCVSSLVHSHSVAGGSHCCKAGDCGTLEY